MFKLVRLCFLFFSWPSCDRPDTRAAGRDAHIEKHQLHLGARVEADLVEIRLRYSEQTRLWEAQ